MDSLDHDMAIAIQIVEGVRKQCSCAYFASEVNITHNTCGNQDILYTVTVNYTENIAAVLNDTIIEIFESFYEQVSHVKCSMFCNTLNSQSSDSSTSSLLPAVLGTLSVLVVIIAASVCVVVILIIVRHKRRKEEPQNLR